MIYYFSGTGNSKYIAEQLALKTQDHTVSIPDNTPSPTDVMGFVCPVYAWGIPNIVLDFIAKLPPVSKAPHYIYAVITCGENAGKAMDMLETALRIKGLKLDLGYSIVMPNNYILMGDIDTPDVQLKKMEAADVKLKLVSDAIVNRKSGIKDVIEGPVPKLLTRVVHPLFTKFATSTKSFYATDACNQCGLCETICPVHSITVNHLPTWSERCTGCLACIHHCPTRAIEYGKKTQKKGRYVMQP